MKWIKLVHVLLLNKVSTFIIIKSQNKVCSTCVSLSLQFFEPRGKCQINFADSSKSYVDYYHHWVSFFTNILQRRS